MSNIRRIPLIKGDDKHNSRTHVLHLGAWNDEITEGVTTRWRRSRCLHNRSDCTPEASYRRRRGMSGSPLAVNFCLDRHTNGLRAGVQTVKLRLVGSIILKTQLRTGLDYRGIRRAPVRTPRRVLAKSWFRMALWRLVPSWTLVR